jgi:hypothetical protein
MNGARISRKLPPQNRRHAVRVALTAIPMLALCGCFGPPKSEINEAVGMARLFHRIAPEAQNLATEETKLAHELTLMIEEAGVESVEKFRQRFYGAVEKLGDIRDRRVALEQQVRQGISTTPLVKAVQEDAIQFFAEQINRDTVWLQMTANIRLRQELERKEDFPEMLTLHKALELFTGEVREDPLTGQIQTLQAEYGFTEEDISQ